MGLGPLNYASYAMLMSSGSSLASTYGCILEALAFGYG